MAAASTEQHRWWKEAVVYQIYPASFADSNGDGWGDIPGIISKLPYISSLGADVLWISPMYPSPLADMGYDISDYKNIDPRYGTLADVDRLVGELKSRGMKLMMDLVVNHTSHEHAWFKESRSGKTSAKRNWYIWRPARGWEEDEGGKKVPVPPNNWAQILGEGNSAWTWDEGSSEFYLSLFTPEQPDLNWENKEVREAVHDVMRFWLERGASGFRMDVINLISKVQELPDAPVTLAPPHKYQPGWTYFANGPRLHEYLREIYEKVLVKYDAITVGEMPGAQDEEEILKVVRAEEKRLQMIFIFDIVSIDDAKGMVRMTWQDWTPKDLAEIVTKWQEVMIQRGGWNSVFIENHDNPRSVSRYTDDSDQWRWKGAKLLALMQTTLSGTLYVYQGEEIGMKNLPASTAIEEYKDVDTINFWKKSETMHKGDDKKMNEARHIIARKARDHARNPVQWNASANAGFSAEGAKPWMVVNDDYKEVNFEKQVNNPEGKGEDGGMSVWHFWQRGLKCRKDHKDVFVYGDFKVVADGSDGIFAYLRSSSSGGRWLVVLNFAGEEKNFSVDDGVEVDQWVAGNYVAGKVDKAAKGKIILSPWEGILGMCKG